jgi:hypothetical protein
MDAVGRHLLPVLVCSLLAAALPAVDGVVLGLAVESLPTDYDFTIRDGAATTTGSDAFDLGLGATAGVRFDAPLGRRLVASLAFDAAFGAHGSTSDDRYQVLLGRVVAGYGYRVDEALTLGAEGWAGAGVGSLHIAGVSGAADAEVDGPLIEFGARAVLDYVVSGPWVVRVALGWQRGRADLAGDGLEVELTQSGPVATLGLGWWF